MQVQRQIDQLLALRASEWHQILENASEEEHAGFVKWLKQSQLHVEEYLETAYTDRILEHLDSDRRVNIEALLARVVPQVVPLTESKVPEAQQPAAQPRRWQLPLTLAAAIATCAIAIALLYTKFGGASATEYSTTIGEQRTVELADSSVVTLNADTELQVRLKETERAIELVHGEALFKVAHDEQRPFRVETRNAVVQAVGTQFNIYERPDGSTKVSVLEGRVKVTANGGGVPANEAVLTTQTLHAGEEAQVLPDGSIHRTSQADVLQAVAWRERRLIFDDAPLEDMVYEFNRYSQGLRLKLVGVPLGSHHYNGIFNAADPESLADLLDREPDLTVERRPGEILIRPRTETGSAAGESDTP